MRTSGFSKGTGAVGSGRHGVRFAMVSILLMIVIACSAAALGATLGDTVYLSGMSYGNPSVYLFLTGPNLPVNGVALDDLTFPAEDGGVTRVSVGDDGKWSFDWDTHAAGGFLDEGSYTVWVVNAPADRSRLKGLEYRTLQVTLASPGLSTAASATVVTTVATVAGSPADRPGSLQPEHPATPVTHGTAGATVPAPSPTAAGSAFPAPVLLLMVAALSAMTGFFRKPD